VTKPSCQGVLVEVENVQAFSPMPLGSSVQSGWGHREGDRDRPRLVIENCRNQASLALPIKRFPPRRHFIQHCAEREDIAARVAFYLGLSITIFCRIHSHPSN
jgi:hypothetical protein